MKIKWYTEIADIEAYYNTYNKNTVVRKNIPVSKLAPRYRGAKNANNASYITLSVYTNQRRLFCDNNVILDRSLSAVKGSGVDISK